MAIRRWLESFSEDVVEVREHTSRELECSRILLKHPNKPVHFSDLDGFEAVGNVWSTRDRVAAALHTTKD